MSTLIVSGFPGVGKTTLAEREPFVLDSDSSKFSWLTEGIRNPDFPDNYLYHIKNSLRYYSAFTKQEVEPYNLILVSSHQTVRNALVEHGLDFTLVYPAREIKTEYIQRYIDRGNQDSFVALLEKEWDSWMDGLEDDKDCKHIRLQSGEYLSDKIKISWKKN